MIIGLPENCRSGMIAIADTAEEGYAAWKFENLNFFGVNLVQLQFAAKPLLDLWKVTLDQHNTASGGPLANVLQWFVFFGEIEGF